MFKKLYCLRKKEKTTQGEHSLTTNTVGDLIIPTLNCAQLAQTSEVCVRSVKSNLRDEREEEEGTISHLHLLVDLPLHGVRRFPAAFIFRWSPFLHLGHSRGSWQDPARIGVECLLRVFSVEQEAVIPGDSGCHAPGACVPHLRGFTTIRVL